jgi:hypothetical protein
VYRNNIGEQPTEINGKLILSIGPTGIPEKVFPYFKI